MAGRRARACALSAVVVCLLLAACDVQPTNPRRSVQAPPQAGDVVVRGAVQQADGKPLVGRTVYITRHVTGGDLAGDLFATLFTGGLAAITCATGDAALAVCRDNAFTTTTTASGSWAERLRKDDVSSNGSLRTMTFSTGARRGPGELRGPAVSADFYPDRSPIRLPALRLWRPHLRGSGDATTFRLTYGALPNAGADVGAQLSSTSRGLFINDKDASRPEVLDARLLEDVTAEASLAARGVLSGHGVTWIAPSVMVTGTAGAPPSRHATCVADPSPLGGSIQPCWLTDGQFGTPLEQTLPLRCQHRPHQLLQDEQRARSRPCPRPRIIRTVTVDLAQSLPLGLVVLRAAEPSSASYYLPGVEVDASVDGSTWQPLAEQVQVFHAPGAEEVVPQPGLVARYVRVVATGPPSFGLNGLTELSVWRGSPNVSPTAQPLVLGQPPLQAAPSNGSSNVWRAVAIALAAVLLLVIVGGLVMIRRRRTSVG